MANETSAPLSGGVAQAVAMTRDQLWHLIAKEIACEEDCQKWPNGCGCAQNAANAILAAQPPAAPVETRNGPADYADAGPGSVRTDQCADLNAPATPLARSSAESAGLANLVLEYAKDLRRNSSGGDDYPWEYAKGTADYLEELVRRANLATRRDEIVAGAFYKTRGDKNNLPHIVGPLEHADDGDAPWQARVYDQIWKWGYDGLANTDGSPHNRDLVERVYRPECLPGLPQPTQVSAERIASVLALSYGRDPDDLTHMTEMCDAENRPVPIWRVYEEQAEALLAVYSIAEKVLLAQPQGARDATIEECAKHLEREADVATNSLHCGDNSATIAATHRVSRAYYEAAKSIRSLALPRPE